MYFVPPPSPFLYKFHPIANILSSQLTQPSPARPVHITLFSHFPYLTHQSRGRQAGRDLHR